MKRILLFLPLLLLTLGFAGRAQAQEGIKVGFRASPMVTWATTVLDSTKSKPEGLDSRTGVGFAFDFVLTAGFTESFAFKTGVTIATKSIKSNTSNAAGDSITFDIDQTTNFTAVEVPIGFKFRSPEIGDGIYIVGHFGANAEINVQNKIKTEGTFAGVNVDSELVDVDGIRLFTASFAPGAGVDWEFDWGMLEFALTYHWGLLSYTDPDEFGGLKSRMNAISLNIGYFF